MRKSGRPEADKKCGGVWGGRRPPHPGLCLAAAAASRWHNPPRRPASASTAGAAFCRRCPWRRPSPAPSPRSSPRAVSSRSPRRATQAAVAQAAAVPLAAALPGSCAGPGPGPARAQHQRGGRSTSVAGAARALALGGNQLRDVGCGSAGVLAAGTAKALPPARPRRCRRSSRRRHPPLGGPAPGARHAL